MTIKWLSCQGYRSHAANQQQKNRPQLKNREKVYHKSDDLRKQNFLSEEKINN